MIRIGELAKRTGVASTTLRAWERRYGLLEPNRTEGGYRLYTEDDEARVHAMTSMMRRGMSAAEAAREIVSRIPAAADPGPGDAGVAERRPPASGEDTSGAAALVAALVDAFEMLDGPRAEALLNRALGAFTLSSALDRVILPALREVGVGWESGRLTVAHEHFASNLIRGRLMALASGWASGSGPAALLACAPGERHDLGLLCFGLILHDRGWRVTFLGADSPMETVTSAAEASRPEVTVICSLGAELSAADTEAVGRLAQELAVVFAGPGTPRLDGIPRIAADPVGAAEELSREAGVTSPPQAA